MARYKLNDDLAPATVSEADGVRYLHLGTPWVQGAMRIRKPHTLELEYIQRMMVWMLMREPAQLGKGHAVQLGLGAGSITRFCYRNMKMKTTVVELNPTVIGVCKLWFHLPDDDARLAVLNVDLYDHEAASPVLDDEVFYANCHRVLADGGVMTVNLFGRDASFARSAGLIADAFGPANVRSIQPTKEGNTVVLAVKRTASDGLAFPDRSTLAARAENIETRFGLPAKKWLRMIRQLPGEPADPTA